MEKLFRVEDNIEKFLYSQQKMNYKFMFEQVGDMIFGVKLNRRNNRLDTVAYPSMDFVTTPVLDKLEELNEHKDLMFPSIVYFFTYVSGGDSRYLPDACGKFYLFDIYSEEEGKFYPPTNELGVDLACKVPNVFISPMIFNSSTILNERRLKNLSTVLGTGEYKLGKVFARDYSYRDEDGKQVLFNLDLTPLHK